MLDREFIVPGEGAPIDLGEIYLSILKNDIPPKVTEYVSRLETEPSADWCKCEWIIAPMDAHISEGHCRNCNHDEYYHSEESVCAWGEGEQCECIKFQGRRKRPGTPNDKCPIHSKEGRILGFFEWMFRAEKVDLALTKKSPKEWLKDPAFEKYYIMDNDGWNHQEWKEQEPITRGEFERRWTKCTTAPKQ